MKKYLLNSVKILYLMQFMLWLEECYDDDNIYIPNDSPYQKLVMGIWKAYEHVATNK